MPVIRAIPADPTDLVLQGEQMRMAAFDQPALGMDSVIQDEDAFLPMNSFIDQGGMVVTRRTKDGALQMRANAGVSTPCGAWIYLDYTSRLSRFVQGTERWTISGTTRDSAGVALGTCRVIALEIGRVAIGGAPVAGETISDGSGIYSVEVPMNTPYQMLAYKPGSPDVGGVSVTPLMPTQV